MHDGQFIHVDPWAHASIWTQMSGSIFWDIWPSILFYTGIATIVTCVNALTVYDLAIPSTMLTVLGTVIGFVISYRTQSAYDRFLEGAVLWGDVITGARQMARIIWFHVPNQVEPLKEGEHVASDADQAQVLIEKKTMLNLIEAHVVALKHYLRGEGGTFYEDLYPITCHLPRYAMPNSVPIARPDLNGNASHHQNNEHNQEKAHSHTWDAHKPSTHYFSEKPNTEEPRSTNHEGHGGRHATHQDHQGNLAVPGSSNAPELSRTNTAPALTPQQGFHPHHPRHHSHGHHPEGNHSSASLNRTDASVSGASTGTSHAHPKGHDAPRRSTSWSGDTLAGDARAVKPLHLSTDSLRHRPGMQSPPRTHGPRSPPQALLPSRLPPPWNFVDDVAPFLAPFRTLYRKIRNHEFQHTLTGLEKIVTTPIPFSYLVHLNHSTWLYLGLLPFQLERYLGIITIPAVCIASFMFLGFLAVSAQIEGPFGYDRNDLLLDHFVHEIVARELQEIAAHPPAGVDDFIFIHANEPFFPGDQRSARQLVKDQVSTAEIRHVLLKGHDRDAGWRSYKANKGHKATRHDTHSTAV